MFLHSLNGLQEAVKASKSFKSATTRPDKPLQADLLSDKCNTIIHFILIKNRWNWKDGIIEPIPLSKRTLADQIGNGLYICQVKNILYEIGVLKTDHKYFFVPNGTGKAKKYTIAQEWIDKGICEVGILDKRTEKKFKNWKKKQIKNLLLDRVHQRIMRNIGTVQFDEKKATEKLKSMNLEGYKALLYESIKETLTRYNTMSPMERIEDATFFYKKARTNRVYHVYANIPKIYRECLTYDGKETMELDLRNSQPTMLYLEYLKQTTHLYAIRNLYGISAKEGREGDIISGSFVNDTTEDENRRLEVAILDGDLYRAVAQYALSIGDVEYYELHQSDRDSFKTDIIAKGLFNVLLPEDKMHKAEKYLLAMFPNFMSWIREMKSPENKYGVDPKNNYKFPSWLAQEGESSIFISGVFGADLGIHSFPFATPIHDGLLIEKEKELFWRELIKEKILEVYPFPDLLNHRLDDMIKSKYN